MHSFHEMETLEQTGYWQGHGNTRNVLGESVLPTSQYPPCAETCLCGLRSGYLLQLCPAAQKHPLNMLEFEQPPLSYL